MILITCTACQPPKAMILRTHTACQPLMQIFLTTYNYARLTALSRSIAFSPTLRIGLNYFALSGLFQRSALRNQRSANRSACQRINNSTIQHLTAFAGFIRAESPTYLSPIPQGWGIDIRTLLGGLKAWGNHQFGFLYIRFNKSQTDRKVLFVLPKNLYSRISFSAFPCAKVLFSEQYLSENSSDYVIFACSKQRSKNNFRSD